MLNQLQPKVEETTIKVVPNSAPILSLGTEDMEILRFERNGDIFIKGKLVTNDMQIVEGFRELLMLNHLMN